MHLQKKMTIYYNLFLNNFFSKWCVGFEWVGHAKAIGFWIDAIVTRVAHSWYVHTQIVSHEDDAKWLNRSLYNTT